MSDYAGHPVLINAWATWRPPCRAEMPALHDFYRKRQAEGFTLLAVNAGEAPAQARSFIQQTGFTFPVLLDPNVALLTDLGIRLALARRHPLLTATVFDLPAVVPHAREITAGAGLADRVMVQEGDFHRQGLGAGHDVALVFGVLNGEPLEGRPALIYKIHDCLKPGDRIVLRDFVLDDDRAGPPEAALFALQMLPATEAGGLDTRDDWMRWLTEAGFAPHQILALPEPVGGKLIVARKPASWLHLPRPFRPDRGHR